jgi:hypothetical protein
MRHVLAPFSWSHMKRQNFTQWQPGDFSPLLIKIINIIRSCHGNATRMESPSPSAVPSRYIQLTTLSRVAPAATSPSLDFLVRALRIS